MESRMKDRVFGTFLVALVVVAGTLVLVLRLMPAATGTPQVPQAVGSPTVSPYVVAEVASQYISETYQIAPGDLQVADASREKDPASGQILWRFQFLDKRNRRTYEVAVDDWGRVVR
jgi:hypothetical protein